MIRLRFLAGPAPWIVEEPGPVARIGRHPFGEVVLFRDSVSRRQCELVEQGAQLLVIDSPSSTSGTCVNGEQSPRSGCVIVPTDVVGNVDWIFHAERTEKALEPSSEQLSWLDSPGAHLLPLMRAMRVCPTVARLLVEHQGTPPELLSVLAEHPSRSLQQAVARHPHTSSKTIRQLLRHYHAEIKQNPSLEQHLRDDPGLAEGLRFFSDSAQKA